MAISPNAGSSLDYRQRVVAFIDVLGFSNLVKASAAGVSAHNKINRLIAIYTVFDWFVPQILNNLVEGGFFSDTFILSAEIDRVLYLFRETGNLCRYLLLQGFPCRGAIVAGLLHHRQRIIIGPALVDAYRAEQSVAIYPRVLVDEASRNYWAEECAVNSVHSHLKSLVKRDCDGHHYLDIFDPQWNAFVPWTDFVPAADAVPSDPAQFLSAALKQIREGLRVSSGNANVHAKYVWLERKCRSHAAALGLETYGLIVHRFKPQQSRGGMRVLILIVIFLLPTWAVTAERAAEVRCAANGHFALPQDEDWYKRRWPSGVRPTKTTCSEGVFFGPITQGDYE